MFGKKVRLVITIITVITVLGVIAPVVASGKNEPVVNGQVNQELQSIIPLSKEMVDQAIATLSKGWMAMSPAEQETFLLLYDPGNSGEIDDSFVEKVLANYRKIREVLDGDIEVAYEPESDKCEGQRLYFIDLTTLHVCPYFLTEPNEVRKARTLVHEMVHKALLVTDRPYYRPTSKQYKTLTPNGPWTAQLPLIGRVIREIASSDTLYHPDAYAHYALAVSGQPGSELYRQTAANQVTTMDVTNIGSSEATTTQTFDSWAATK